MKVPIILFLLYAFSSIANASENIHLEVIEEEREDVSRHECRICAEKIGTYRFDECMKGGKFYSLPLCNEGEDACYTYTRRRFGCFGAITEVVRGCIKSTKCPKNFYQEVFFQKKCCYGQKLCNDWPLGKLEQVEEERQVTASDIWEEFLKKNTPRPAEPEAAVLPKRRTSMPNYPSNEPEDRKGKGRAHSV